MTLKENPMKKNYYVGSQRIKVKLIRDTLLFQVPSISQTVYSLFISHHNKRPNLKKSIMGKDWWEITVFSLGGLSDTWKWQSEFQILFPESVIVDLKILRSLYEERTAMLLSFGI